MEILFTALSHAWFLGLLCWLLIVVPVVGLIFITPQK